MLTYHMGWEGENAGVETRGKRIRPLLLLLCTAAAGGDWQNALPGAAAVELIHNFSLVHDDIQDQSLTRRGRATVWSKWGAAQAINIGDALFSLAQISLSELALTVSSEAAIKSFQILNDTCLRLTQGQFLDLAYESRKYLKIADYWPMIAGKTAALLSACTTIGAICAQVDAQVVEIYREFGEKLGLAFQVQDDFLGIWGDAAQTGKSTTSDLVSGKKSIPVLYGLEQNGVFANRWKEGGIRDDEIQGLAVQLKQEGAYHFVQECSKSLSEQALHHLDLAEPAGDAGAALHSLVEKLLRRNA
jgi:geranylgeranyl diphosphate synthase, type I